MQYMTIVETTAGVLSVRTRTLPSIWTILTFGIFRKAVCRINGPAIRRMCEIQKEAGSSVHWRFSRHVFKTFRVKFWHNFVVEYVQVQGSCMSDHHRYLQWSRAMREATEANDIKRIKKLIRERRQEDREDDELID